MNPRPSSMMPKMMRKKTGPTKANSRAWAARRFLMAQEEGKNNVMACCAPEVDKATKESPGGLSRSPRKLLGGQRPGNLLLRNRSGWDHRGVADRPPREHSFPSRDFWQRKTEMA